MYHHNIAIKLCYMYSSFRLEVHVSDTRRPCRHPNKGVGMDVGVGVGVRRITLASNVIKLKHTCVGFLKVLVSYWTLNMTIKHHASLLIYAIHKIRGNYLKVCRACRPILF